jgi:hypothetical protein
MDSPYESLTTGPRTTSNDPTYPVPTKFQNPDVILRSSDNIEFRAHMSTLSQASQFFQGMFDIPTPVGISPEDGQFFKDGLPIVVMTETHRTVENLLRLCYQKDDPVIENFQEARDTVSAMIKYEMDEKWSEWMKAILVTFAEKEPWRLYAFALHLCRIASHAPRRMEECAREAARMTLRYQLPLFPTGPHPDGTWDNVSTTWGNPTPGTDDIHPDDLTRLLSYHKVCRIRLLEMTITGDLIVRTGKHWVFLHPCASCTTSDVLMVMLFDLVNRMYGRAAQWWMPYFERMKEAVQQRPCGNAIESRELWSDLVKDLRSTCGQCSEMAALEMPEFVALLSQEVDKAVAEVSHALFRVRTNEVLNTTRFGWR